MTAPVVLVTGGGGGIGAAVAEQLGRTGWSVVTMDPLVSLDGTERLPEPAETTAGRIVAGGGVAQASSASVTDRRAVRDEVDRLVDELGRIDAVVNVAGITRPTGFATGTDDEWRSVLGVHLDGYVNVLAAVLPHMTAAGRGRVLGVTSGSGWRAADAGAYSCAKRAVASLTWQLGRVAPPGVAVNAMSPIAVTRMVTAALERAAARGGGSSTGGLSLGSMPEPADLGPLGAHLVGEGFAWCRGQVVFVGGSEAALVEPPRLLEVASVGRGVDLREVVDRAFVAAEVAQVGGGGGNPRFPAATSDPAVVGGTCAVVTDRPEVAGPLRGRFATCHLVAEPPTGFDGAVAALAALGPLDVVVVALAGTRTSAADASWERVLAEHEGLAAGIHADAAWARAAADHAVGTGRPLRLISVVDATTSGGRSRAQAAAQLARAGRGATGDLVTAFVIGAEGREAGPAAALAAHLAAGTADELAGAELVAHDGWVGLRSHPRPSASVVLDGTAVPDWFDAVLGEAVR